MKLQSIVSITCTVRPWRCHNWCATRSQPLKKKKKKIIWVVSGVKTSFSDVFFFRLNAVWSTSVTRPLHHSLTVKNKKTPHNKALVFIVTDVRMRALTPRNRSLMEESGIRFLCDALVLPCEAAGSLFHISSLNSHRSVLKRLQSGLFSAGRCFVGPIGVFLRRKRREHGHMIGHKSPCYTLEAAMWAV